MTFRVQLFVVSVLSWCIGCVSAPSVEDPVEALSEAPVARPGSVSGWTLADCIDGRTDKTIPVYAAGEEMTFVFSLRGFKGLDSSRCSFVWTRTGDDGLRSSGRAPADHPLTLKTSLDRAGFVRYYVELHDAADEVVLRSSKGVKKVFFDGGAGVDVFKIGPGVAEPDDFDLFWSRHRAELAAVRWKGLERVEKIDSGRDDVDLYTVRVPCAGGMPVTGFLSVPAKARTGVRYPARISYQGYGASWGGGRKPASDRLCTDWIVFNCTAHGFDLMREKAYYSDLRTKVMSNGYGYAFDPEQNADPETAYFRGMTFRVMRALEFLKGRPEWNGKTLEAVGGSMGGLQVIWSAALDPDVTQAYPSIPWCCDIGGTEVGRNRGDWYVRWVKGLGYYDPVNMAPRIPKSCTVRIPRFGLGDYICPPTGVMAFYNRLSCPKEARGVQNSTHGYVVPKPRQEFNLVGEEIKAVE